MMAMRNRRRGYPGRKSSRRRGRRRMSSRGINKVRRRIAGDRF